MDADPAEPAAFMITFLKFALSLKSDLDEKFKTDVLVCHVK